MQNICFQDALDTNPVQYMRSMPLNGVRRELPSETLKAARTRDLT